MDLRGWLLTLVCLWPASTIFAHAAPVMLDPPSGTLVAPGPVTLRLGMSQAVELRFSRVTVRGQDRTWNAGLRLEGDKRVAADLPELAPGRYDITWRVLSVDGHLTEGTYYVVVTPQGAATSAPGPAGGAGARGAALGTWAAGLLLALVGGVMVSRRLRQSLMRG